MKNVLIVDDDPELIELYVCLLTIAKCNVVIASGLKTMPADLTQFDALLTDHSFGNETTGFDVAAIFRKSNAGGIVVMITGRCAVKETGDDVDVLLHKPVRAEKIIEFFRYL